MNFQNKLDARVRVQGLPCSPRSGFWRLTEGGKTFNAEHPGPFSDALREQVATANLTVRLRGHDTAPQPTAQVLSTKDAATTSPDDRLGEALQELRESAERELLELLSGVSPGFFESIVLDLLHRMGYGTRRQDLQRVGGSGDGGIDGIISLDRLGLEKVYVQAKRWQGSAGRPELQAFYGALAGQKARKGGFITTSSFTGQALEFARSVEGIVLVDGQRLAGLMIDHEVGVTSRTVKIPKIDGDYFDEESA